MSYAYEGEEGLGEAAPRGFSGGSASFSGSFNLLSETLPVVVDAPARGPSESGSE
jgi:hypothetical protein